MFSYLSFFLIICVSVIIRSEDIISINLNHNKYDPLVVTISKNNIVGIPSKIEMTSDAVRFRVPESIRLVFACPAENDDEIKMSNLFKQPLLFEKEFKPDLSCNKPLVPSFWNVYRDGSNNCGRNGEGTIYFFGYMVNFKSINYSADGHTQAVKFVSIYKMCYSTTIGTIFATYPSVPTYGPRNDISQEDFEQMVLNRILENEDLNELYKNKKLDEKIYQFVPYNDMTLTSWQITTLFDINTSLMNETIKKPLDTINKFFHDMTINRQSEPLVMYSGVTHSSSGSKWYWKAGHKLTPDATRAIAILIFVSESQSEIPQVPCENGKQILCQTAGLQENLETFQDLFCCIFDKSFANSVGLTIRKNDEVQYPVLN